MAAFSLLYRIQHLAGRDEPLARLLERLPVPPAVEVITDHDRDALGPNPFRCYLKCLQDIPDGITHVCVIQDDALPCEEADRRIKEAVGDRSGDVLSLFVGGLPNRTRKDFYQAMLRGDRWTPVYFRDIAHVVCLIWPVPIAQSFVEWYAGARIPGPIPPKSDDAVVGYWARTTKHQLWAHVPCLVEHPDDVPSTVHSIGRQGDKGRRAIHFIDSNAE